MKKQVFLLRQEIVKNIRDFFYSEGFLEVDTPVLVASPDTAPYNEVFETDLGNVISGGSKEIQAFLTPSPEFFMKKLLVQGYGSIFQICKAFRNNFEGNSPHHNPEFTIMEWYRTPGNYTDIMKDCENLVNYIFDQLMVRHPEFISGSSNLRCRNKFGMTKNKGKIIAYQGKSIDISKPWIRISVKEAFKKYAGINLDEFLDIKNAREIAKKKGYKVEKENTWEQVYHQIFLNEIEPKFLDLEKPVILYDYPAPLAALSRRKKSDPRYAERFEFYIAGVELGNAFSELTNYKEQEKRLQENLKERKRLGLKVFDYDHDFIENLKNGLPETGGIAIGIDRLVMIFANIKNIDEVILFPANQIFTKQV